MKGITQEEVSRLTKAMKDDKFREYMTEYTREASDPKHRKEYMDYLAQLEAKGEMPEGQQLLRCQPGICVKTWISFKNGQTQKCFFNIVHTDRLHDASFDRQDNGGHGVRLPYTLSPPRQERDKKDEVCMVCDMAVSSYTFCQAAQNAPILKMLVDTACDGLTERFLKNYEEVKKDFKVMRRFQCKGGYPHPMSVKADLLKDKGTRSDAPSIHPGAKEAVTPGELKQMRNEAKEKMQKEKDDKDARKREAAERKAEAAAAAKAAEEAAAPRIRIPKHKLVYSGAMDLTDFMEAPAQKAQPISSIPRTLKLSVEVPTVKRVGDITLEVTSNNVVVEVPEKYYLDLPLPYEVDENAGTAKFDKTAQILALELPVLPQAPDPEALKMADKFWNAPTEETPDADGAVSERGGSSDEEDAAAGQEAKAADVATDASTLDTARGRELSADRPTEAGDLRSADSREELAGPEQQQPPTPPEPHPPQRERLELAPAGGDLLQIVKEPTEPEGPACAAEGEGDEHELELEPPPDFEPAEAFTGARPGCAFKLGDLGLGYYRDYKAKARPRKKLTAASRAAGASQAASTLALVEVTSSSSTKVPRKEVTPPPLPADLQAYVDTRHRCATRLKDVPPAAAVEVQSWKLDWRQTRQNLVLLFDVSAYEVADVQISFAGRSLAVLFCARRLGSEGDWARHVVRRVLCGAIDPRQWHVEAPGDAGSLIGRCAGKRLLTIVLRKVDREPWPEIVDLAGTALLLEAAQVQAPPAPASVEGAPGRDPAPGEAEATHSTAARPAGVGGVAPPASAVLGEIPVAALGGVAILEAIEDSAELDAAEPIVLGPSADADAGDGTAGGNAVAGPAALDTSAAAALQQSAMVMGQAVMLKTRLMYQLL